MSNCLHAFFNFVFKENLAKFGFGVISLLDTALFVLLFRQASIKKGATVLMGFDEFQ